MTVDWGILQPQPAVADTYLKGFTQGQAMAKDQVVRSAFAKLATDPAGAQADLLRVGAIPEASAIANLQNQQAQRSLLTAAYAKLGFGPNAPNAITGQPAVQPAAQPAPAADPTFDATAAPGNVAHPPIGADGQPAPAGQAPQDVPHPSDLNPDQAAHALDMSHAFDALGMEVAGLPYADRMARIAAEKPQLLAKGVPEQAIDGFDPTDENIAKIHGEMAQLRGMLPPTAAASFPGGGQQAATPAGGQVQPTAQPSPAQPATGGGFNLLDPNTQQGLQALSIVDPQAAGPMISLGTAVMPGFEGGRPGAPIIDKHTGKITGFAPEADGRQMVSDGQGGWKMVVLPGATEAGSQIARSTAAATAEGKGAGELSHAGALAHVTASGKGAGEAPYQLITVQMPPDEQHPGGFTAQMTLDQFKAYQGGGSAGGTGGGGAPGAASGGPHAALGQSGGPGAEQFAKTDADAYSKTVATVADPTTINGLQNGITSARQAVIAAQAINPNAFTPREANVAAVLNSVGLDSARANDLAYYKSLIPQVTKGSFTTFPRLEKEFELVKDAIPQLSTPRDAAALTFATIAARKAKDLAYSQFASQYQGTPSQRALNQAWQASPQAQASIFADPVFRNLTMDGKPAVYINQTAAPNGHIYGVFRPNTPNQQTFLVQ